MSAPRLLLSITLALLLANSAFAADPTADLLGATHVNDFIRLSVETSGDKDIVVGEVDRETDTFHAMAGRTFAADGDVKIRIANFNPLLQVWTVDSAASVDPNFAAIKLFLDDLKSLQAALPDVGKQELAEGVTEESPECIELRQLITAANDALKDPGLTADNLKEIADKATGYQGVSDAITALKKTASKMKENNVSARKALQDIRDEFGRSPSGGAPIKTCKAITSDILVDYIYATGRADRIIASRAALAASIEDLIKTSLTKYDNPKKWAGAGKVDLVFTTVTPTFENQFTVSASMKSRTVDVADDAATITTSATASAAVFMIRRETFWVPERTAAVIYNRLTYPKYGTHKDEKTGNLVVKREDDMQPVGGAMMLNLIPRFSRTAPVHPMLQIGVSSAKDFPGFLAGIGLRFSQPTAFSISVGGMITRYKDLDGNLKENDVVTGTNDIDKHLVYKTSPIALYGAIQMKF
jgi:hypothetical protein